MTGPTDELRRKVAAALRGPFDVVDNARYCHLNGTLLGIGLYAGSEDELRRCAMDLADFIDPAPERTCRNDGVGVFRCDGCGAFVKNDAVTDCIGSIPIRFCPNCGAKVVEP